MFYTAFIFVLSVLVFLANGRIHIEGKENLPTDTTYILAAPHRSWLDPVMLAIATRPASFAFIGKKEIFDLPVLGWFAHKLNAIPVDRKNPGPSAIKLPVKALKNDELNVAIFPSGTRHSSDLKGGVLTIAKLSGKPIVPAVYSGPLTLTDLFKRKKTIVKFGEPMMVDRKTRLDQDTILALSKTMQDTFDRLDEQQIV